LGKKRVLSEGDINQLVLPETGQLLGIVTQMFGYDRIMVKCSDGADRICRIRGKMKRRTWIKNGDVVLVAPWDFQTSRADVLWRYTQNQAQILHNKGILTM
jgi:translation initiation factor 1A